MIEFKELPASKNSLSKRTLVRGFGINDADYITEMTVNGKRVVCPYYRTWLNIISRCHGKSAVIGLSVSDEWVKFSCFRSWMKSQDWKGKQLDKDLLIDGNKVYSEEACLFVACSVKNLLRDCKANRGSYPIGVCLHGGKFSAVMNRNGWKKSLGRFDTAEDAEQCYLKAKSAYVREVAIDLEPALKAALIRKAEEMEARIYK